MRESHGAPRFPGRQGRPSRHGQRGRPHGTPPVPEAVQVHRLSPDDQCDGGDALGGDLEAGRGAFAAFEDNVKKVAVLREILRGFDTKGFEARVTTIEERLKDPRKHLAAEADVEELREAVEKTKRDAESKAADTAREREIQDRARQVFEMVLKHRQESGKGTAGLTESAVIQAMEEKPTARDEKT